MGKQKKDVKDGPPDGAFPWRPEEMWGVGEEREEPEVILLDAGPGTIGPKGTRPKPGRSARVRRQPKPRVEHDAFDRFSLALSASLARAWQKCEAEGTGANGKLVVEVRSQRAPV